MKSVGNSLCITFLCIEEQHFPASVILTLLVSSGQVVVPGEVRFPNACCVGIASQTSLSLFNPSERWQQVSITVTSLAIDGEKVSREHRGVSGEEFYAISKHLDNTLITYFTF